MPPDSPPAAVPAPDLPASTPPGLSALFVAFAKISLAGFGGVLVWARRGIVDQHRWMTAEENLWAISEYLWTVPHLPVLPPELTRKRRRIDRRLYDAGFLGSVK